MYIRLAGVSHFEARWYGINVRLVGVSHFEARYYAVYSLDNFHVSHSDFNNQYWIVSSCNALMFCDLCVVVCIL
jgi:hypothetical protein